MDLENYQLGLDLAQEPLVEWDEALRLLDDYRNQVPSGIGMMGNISAIAEQAKNDGKFSNPRQAELAAVRGEKQRVKANTLILQQQRQAAQEDVNQARSLVQIVRKKLLTVVDLVRAESVELLKALPHIHNFRKDIAANNLAVFGTRLRDTLIDPKMTDGKNGTTKVLYNTSFDDDGVLNFQPARELPIAEDRMRQAPDSHDAILIALDRTDLKTPATPNRISVHAQDIRGKLARVFRLNGL